MNNNKLFDKPTLVFLVLAGFFICNALIAEFMGVKIFSLEKTLGWTPVNWTLFGESGLSFNLSAGVLLWPVVFLMTDVINEYFGKKGVQFLSYLTVALISYAFLMYYFAIGLEPADFWPTSHIDSAAEAEQAAIAAKVGDYNYAYTLIFGQGLWIIVASIIAFLVGQMIDVLVFHKIKTLTGEKMVWLRATGSTFISQFIDTFIVLFIAFYLGANWPIMTILALGMVNYSYKFFMALVLTPVIYLVHYVIDAYLGKELAEKMKKAAAISE